MTTYTQPELDTSRMKAQSAKRMLADAIAWIYQNPRAFRQLEDHVLAAYNRGDRWISIRDYFPTLRRMELSPTGEPVKLKNALSAPLGRILVTWHPELEGRIKLSRSKTDGMLIPMRGLVVASKED